MRITAKVDYAVRAVTELAAAQLASPGERHLCKAEALAEAQRIPTRFLEGILGELRRSGIVTSQRGADGGYWLSRAAGEITVADVIRAVEGPLADVHGAPPEEVDYQGAAQDLRRVWVATRAALRGVLEQTTVADIALGRLPASVEELAALPDAWTRR
ncbi:MAG TPA: Rrf2 family transcriptional regulator [Acidimicrobiales bacterium]|nr:Rrf2 family transcriptional regulator [Acidimicrobiales bacterium]